jgi:hypothetical protein
MCHYDTNYNKKKRNKERKRFQSHTKTPMTTSLISSEGSQWYEYKKTKKCH